MHLILNGETIEQPRPCSLEALLRELKLKAERVATVVNDDVVPSSLRAARQVQEGDRIEILTFAGGG
ncbi:MAG: sulfur carrier protein ThiS [Kiritimatiellae bacterium]|nr:sulfur carrier protein ThiS [Verrucomicrobiota bacterium]MCG2659706.1 sulfur carrier protein ThiS [Kiritimatiellia bacterium]